MGAARGNTQQVNIEEENQSIRAIEDQLRSTGKENIDPKVGVPILGFDPVSPPTSPPPTTGYYLPTMPREQRMIYDAMRSIKRFRGSMVHLEELTALLLLHYPDRLFVNIVSG